MRIEDIAVRLRTRSAYEAVDLGYAMTREWAAQIYPAWATVFLTFALVVQLLLLKWPYLAFLVIWWMKPLLDRIILHSFAGAAFGAAPSIADVWRAIPSVLRQPGVMASLTWRRLDPSRAFASPVEALERQAGKPARQRRAVLAREGGGAAFWLMIAAVHFEFVVVLAVLVSIEMFLPIDQAVLSPFNWWMQPLPAWAEYTINAVWVAMILVMEPFYVGAGFALYLNARTILEGWDIELAFKRMSERLSRESKQADAGQEWRGRGSSRSNPVGATALALMLALGIGAASVASTDALAQSCPIDSTATDDDGYIDADKSQYRLVVDAATGTQPTVRATPDTKALDAVNTILADPIFGESKETWRIKYIGPGSEDKKPEKPKDIEWLTKFAEFMAIALRALAWGLGAVAVVVVLYLIIRKLKIGDDRQQQNFDQLFGLDVRPESLPDDVAAAAAALLARGDVRGALSLLYRGALVSLLKDGRFEISRGDTEGVVVRQVASHYGGINASKPTVFARLVAAWQQVAYAHRAPHQDEVADIVKAWAAEFADGAPIARTSASREAAA